MDQAAFEYIEERVWPEEGDFRQNLVLNGIGSGCFAGWESLGSITQFGRGVFWCWRLREGDLRATSPSPIGWEQVICDLCLHGAGFNSQTMLVTVEV